MKVSGDQNTVTIELTARFVEGGDCYECALFNTNGLECEKLCQSNHRADGKNGNFKEVAGDE
jgi:hypothetical protein